jgi:hypothetical protein
MEGGKKIKRRRKKMQGRRKLGKKWREEGE